MSGIIGQGNIIKEGLIFWLDSANPKSFAPPYTTTTWRSLDSNSNSVTLTNGPTFSTDFGGIITLDGTDDGLGQSQLFSPSIRNGNITGETPNIDFELTFEMVIRFKENLTGTTTFFRTDATSFRVPPIALYRIVGNPANNLLSAAGYTNTTGGSVTVITSFIPYNLNQWYHVIMSMRKTSSTTGEWFLMRNGVILAQQTLTDISWWQNYSATISNNGNRIQAMIGVANHDRAVMRLYRKGLTQEEALRNYNATRGRFGI
jgi:hypothetical protein